MPRLSHHDFLVTVLNVNVTVAGGVPLVAASPCGNLRKKRREPSKAQPQNNITDLTKYHCARVWAFEIGLGLGRGPDSELHSWTQSGESSGPEGHCQVTVWPAGALDQHLHVSCDTSDTVVDQHLRQAVRHCIVPCCALDCAR